MNKIKSLIGVLAVALLSTVSALAAPWVQLAWSANPTNEIITAYIIHYGPASTVYTNTVNVGTNTTGSVSNLTVGANYYFIVTAKNDIDLESDPSNEIWLTIPPTNVVVRTIGATNITRTNVALVGVVSNLPPPYAGFFEYIEGTNWVVSNVIATAMVAVTNQSNYVFQTTIPVIATNYTFRFLVTNAVNGSFLYVSVTKSFMAVPPSKPTQIKFSTTIIQTTSIMSTNWDEVMTASVIKDYPPTGVGFLRSRMDYALLTNPPPGEFEVVNLASTESDSAQSSPQSMPLLRARVSSRTAPPTPGP